MKKISEILQEKSALSDVVALSNVWKKSVTKEIVNITTPSKLSAEGELLVLVHDNIWFSQIGYFKDQIKERLAEKGFEVKKITFKYKPRYEKLESGDDNIKYEIGDEQNFFIEKLSKNIDNEYLKKSFTKMLCGYFKNHSIEEFLNREDSLEHASVMREVEHLLNTKRN